jgi:site-specific DNA-methyltransferase (adenine-specific)
LEENSIDFVLTSPPYDAVRDYEGRPAIDLPAIGQQVARVLKLGGVAMLVMQDQTQDGAKSLTTFKTIVDWCTNSPLRLFETVIYHRPGVPGKWWNTRFRVDHEYMPIFVKGSTPLVFNKQPLMVLANRPGRHGWSTHRLTSGEMQRIESTDLALLKCRGTVWQYHPSKTNGLQTADALLKKQHPATFPNDLAFDAIRCFTESGDLVLDPFVGSGTTAVASLALGRRCIGIDISANYLDLAAQRCALLRGEHMKPEALRETEPRSGFFV